MSASESALFHHPVLLDAVLAAARGAIRAVDGTLGDGGHTQALRAAGMTVLAIDRDPDAIRIASDRLGPDQVRYRLGAFFDPDVLDEINAFHPGFILLDLGVSSRQLDQDARGFTFRPGAPLDMRMGDGGQTAADMLNDGSASELQQIFADYGDERKARRLADEVVRRRARNQFATSDDFVNAIRGVLGPRSGPPDFARLFQSLRIAVNDELEGLRTALPLLRDSLTPGGAITVISYHSGEDRVVKHAFREWGASCICSPEQPLCTCRGRPLGVREPRKAIEASPDEAIENPRARSARLRTFRVRDDA